MHHNHPPQNELPRRTVAVGSFLAASALVLSGCSDQEKCGGEVSVDTTKRINVGAADPVWVKQSIEGHEVLIRKTMLGKVDTTVKVGESSEVDGAVFYIEQSDTGALIVKCDN